MTRGARSFDVAVIGGGLVGASIAYGLVDRVDRVAVLDEGDVAFRASRGNFGLVWVQSKGAGLSTYGAWTLQPWGWTLGIVGVVIGLIINTLYILNGSEIGSQIVSIAISAVILYYLFTPAVKQAFGRA